MNEVSISPLKLFILVFLGLSVKFNLYTYIWVSSIIVPFPSTLTYMCVLGYIVRVKIDLHIRRGAVLLYSNSNIIFPPDRHGLKLITHIRQLPGILYIAYIFSKNASDR